MLVTWLPARAYAARILAALAIGLLLPASGHRHLTKRGPDAPPSAAMVALQWGLAASMLLFAWTLQDRIAEIGIACSVTLGLIAHALRVRRARAMA